MNFLASFILLLSLLFLCVDDANSLSAVVLLMNKRRIRRLEELRRKRLLRLNAAVERRVNDDGHIREIDNFDSAPLQRAPFSLNSRLRGALP